MTEITSVCILCFIFDPVFHRILDFITRLDIYPGLFFFWLVLVVHYTLGLVSFSLCLRLFIFADNILKRAWLG